ncbi:MAG: sulfotransferase [Cyclobacteriaceae bacterium]
MQKNQAYSEEDLGITSEEYTLYQRMIDHLPTGLIQGGGFPNIIEKLLTYQKFVSPRQYRRILTILIGRLLFEPFRLTDQGHASRIKSTNIEYPPIFILGVYRSGTTHLHNLMSTNKLLAHITNQQAANPESFISGQLLHQHLARAFTPKERPLDAMKISPHSPQEHQFALLNMVTPVYSDFFLFPSQYQDLLDLSVINDLPDAWQLQWKQSLRYLVQKLTYVNQGKQLVLKNPHDTANIATLLELFPNAKFIFIHRNPEKVVPSMINTFRAMMYGLQLEGRRFKQLTPEAIFYFKNILTPTATESTFLVYQKLMRQYFAERHLIPTGNLFEVSYDALIQYPMQTILQLHGELGIRIEPGYVATLQSYITSIEQKKYQTNKFSPLPDDIKIRMHQELGFIFERLGYRAVPEKGVP